MAMNPRTHPRGAPPDFSMAGLPANPNPSRITNALWWLVCMRERLEPGSENGGTFANKPGHHNAGENLKDYGLGDPRTDSSIRYSYDRSGPWWEEFSSAHDWTFPDAKRGDYKTIIKYCRRLYNAMRDPNDLRPDDVYAYFIGQIDGDVVVEGYNERTNDDESGDESHLWHRHDSIRRNAVGFFGKMWQALTIDMGWTYDEWKRSVTPQPAKEWDEMATKAEVEAVVKAGIEAVLNDPQRLPGVTGQRVHDRDGWGEMSLRTQIAYIFEGVISVGNSLRAFIEYEKAEDTAEAGSATSRAEALGRVEDSLARLEALVTPTDTPA